VNTDRILSLTSTELSSLIHHNAQLEQGMAEQNNNNNA
jgi:hypothetical protein